MIPTLEGVLLCLITQKINMFALADNRAQMVVMGPKHVALQGVKEKEYLPAKKTIQVAD